jgi:flagellar hook protein FlgE
MSSVNGALTPAPMLDLSGVSQFGTSFAVSTLSQNGQKPGKLTSINIDTSGVVMGSYDNGKQVPAGQIQLATFANSQGLSPNSGGTWSSTPASGTPVSGAPGTGNFGTLTSGALEDSNVDLTKALVDMMTAQRSYQASAQTIKTQDQVLSTLVNLR